MILESYLALCGEARIVLSGAYELERSVEDLAKSFRKPTLKFSLQETDNHTQQGEKDVAAVSFEGGVGWIGKNQCVY